METLVVERGESVLFLEREVILPTMFYFYTHNEVFCPSCKSKEKVYQLDCASFFKINIGDLKIGISPDSLKKIHHHNLKVMHKRS